MKNKALDCLFVHSDSSTAAYQSLSGKFSAIEPPTWSLLLAESCRSKGFNVGILDCCAEQINVSEAVDRIVNISPRVTCFVVYGQNPNAGTTSMIGATALASELSSSSLDTHITFVGSHVSALPRDVLAETYIDSILLNEGVYALWNLLRSNLNGDNLINIRGIGWKKPDGEIVLNIPERIVPQERMDIDMPGYAWDLLPMKSKPLDLYRSHVWHGDFNEQIRTPYAAIYTSLGCAYGCEFCMINILNRTDNSADISSGDSRIMRFWSPDWVLKQFSILRKLGVKTIRLSDEMFLLNHRYYVPILNRLVKDEYDLHMWAYSRIDTVREKMLGLVRAAGIKWLALGIEAGSQIVRQEVSKGSFKDVNVRDIVKMINANDINVIGNYIVGFPGDNYETMTSTLNMALELNTEMMNVYPCQALPGSPLYTRARKEGWALPSTYEEFGFLSYECNPLPTKHLSGSQVLEFRDYFWSTYFKNPAFLSKVESRFGLAQRINVEEMAKHYLKRKVLE
tara:strand:+ start:1579 stop:3108 length:1530 start_codon:yes stop_codon:yes gene_type:complete